MVGPEKLGVKLAVLTCFAHLILKTRTNLWLEAQTYP